MVVVMVGRMDTNLNPNVQDEVKMTRRRSERWHNSAEVEKRVIGWEKATTCLGVDDDSRAEAQDDK